MATLILEDGTGVAGANTYALLATVETYHTDRANTAWTSVVYDDPKVAAILRAMSYLEAQPWVGQPLNIVGWSSGQSLQWPRGYVMMDGYDWPTDEVPPKVVQALCEAALVELSKPGALSVALERGGAVKREKIDVIETEYFDGASSKTQYTAITQALRGLVMSSNSVQLVRV
jgi:hypothetical protein